MRKRVELRNNLKTKKKKKGKTKNKKYKRRKKNQNKVEHSSDIEEKRMGALARGKREKREKYKINCMQELWRIISTI